MVSRPIANVDYTSTTTRSETLLPTPDPADTLHTIAGKLLALAQVVEQGKSLAARTGFKETTQQERDPLLIARATMSPKEVTLFDDWVGEAVIPAMDCSACKMTGPPRCVRYGQDDQIDASNAFWDASENHPINTLITAVARVHGAQKYLVDGQSELTEVELAELQTCRKIVIVAERTSASSLATSTIPKKLSSVENSPLYQK